MTQVALIVIDVQTALIEQHPYNEHQMLENIRRLIAVAREHQKQVIYVRHDDGEGSDLERDTPGWQIHGSLAPMEGDFIVEKRYNSAFRKTGLNAYLKSQGLDTLVLVGLQTEYCMDATVKSAFDLDYDIIIPKGTNSTFSNAYLSGEKLYEFYNERIWNGRFARVLDMEAVVKLLQEQA